jgi:hypothetical protein
LYRARFREDQVLVDGSYSDWSRLDNLARTAALNGVTLQPGVLITMPLEVCAAEDRSGARPLRRLRRRGRPPLRAGRLVLGGVRLSQAAGDGLGGLE